MKENNHINSPFIKFLIKERKEISERREGENATTIYSNKDITSNLESIFKIPINFLNLKGGIENILFNKNLYGNNYREVDLEKNMLLLGDSTKLQERDPKRYYLGSVPVANYVFTKLLKDNEITLKLDFFGDENPFKQKYNGEKLKAPEEKFECMRDYINENSFAKDAAGIGGFSGATDFLQLYKYAELGDKEKIIELTFNTLNSSTVNDFMENYEALGDELEKGDFKLKRLKNRLYFVFTFVLNNVNPTEFPIYFGTTRNVLEYQDIWGYKNFVNVYKEFLKNEELQEYFKKYEKEIILEKENYVLGEFHKKDLFEKHIKYKFFQDIYYCLYHKFLWGEDYLDNYYEVGEIFTLDNLKGGNYVFEKKEDLKEFIKSNIEYLVSEGYIIEVSTGKFEVKEKSDYYIENR